jgi:hypothetical protein
MNQQAEVLGATPARRVDISRIPADGLWTLLRPGSPPRWWVKTVAVVLAATVAGIAAMAWAGVAWRKGTHSYFEEQKIGTLLSGAVLFGSALLCWMTARHTQGAAVRFWLVSCGLFALAGCDDLFRIHEKLDLWLHRLGGADRDNPLTDHLDDALVALYPLAALVLWYRHRQHVLSFPWMVLTMAAAFAAFAAMAVLDWAERFKTVEESLKLIAGVLILLGLLCAYAEAVARNAAGGRGNARD